VVERGGSRTLARGLSVLRALGDAGDGATVAQVSVATGLDRAVLYRLLDTLVAEGFVVRDDSTRLFHLGVALVEMGAKAGRGIEVARLALGGMQQLMQLSREAVCLAVRDRGDLVVVERVEPPGLFVRVGYGVGFRHPVTVGAHGQALLAMSAADGDGPGLDDAAREAIRRRGYAVSSDELEHGASGVAAPILDRDGHAVASIGVVAPTPRLPDPSVLGPRISQVATEISRRLGHGR
jgi:DNA-binding IclR family transcriptional regulator